MSARKVVVPSGAGGEALATRAMRTWTGRPPDSTVLLPLTRLGVALAAAAVLLGPSPSAYLVAGILFVCLERSSDVTRGALGPATTAATGAVTGLLATLPLALWLHSPAPLGTALAICAVLPPIDYAVRSRIVGRRRVLVVGAAGSARELSEELRWRRNARFQVVAVLDERELGTDVAKAVQLHEPDLVVSASGPAHTVNAGATVIGLDDFFDRALERVPPRLATEEWLGDVPGRRGLTSTLSKRAFDIAVATTGLVATLPLWPALVFLAFSRRGGLLLRQVRVGEGGKLFTMYKLRTMQLDAEQPGEAIWARSADPRVTIAGRFLRETHLDELPQLWNVLKGEMSIVGPRPERPEFQPMLQEAIPHWTMRQVVKPGVTGWAQVCLGYAGDRDASEEKLSYDLWYIRHRSLLLDLAISLRTLSSLAPRRVGAGLM